MYSYVSNLSSTLFSSLGKGLFFWGKSVWKRFQTCQDLGLFSTIKLSLDHLKDSNDLLWSPALDYEYCCRYIKFTTSSKYVRFCHGVY